MDVFDDIIESAKTAAEKVGEVTGNVVKKSKQFLDMSQLRSELKGSYSRLGELIYQKKAQGEEFTGEDIDVILEEIRYLKAAMDVMEDEEEEKKDGVCSKCHWENTTDAKYCSGCGIKL